MADINVKHFHYQRFSKMSVGASSNLNQKVTWSQKKHLQKT